MLIFNVTNDKRQVVSTKDLCNTSKYLKKMFLYSTSLYGPYFRERNFSCIALIIYIVSNVIFSIMPIILLLVGWYIPWKNKFY